MRACLADVADLCLRTGLDPDILRSAFQVQARRYQPAVAQVPGLDRELCIPVALQRKLLQVPTKDIGSTRPSTPQISESDEITDKEDAITPVPRPRPQHLEPRADVSAARPRPCPTRRTQRQLFPTSSTPSTEIPVIDLTSPEGPAAKAGEAELEEAEAEAGRRERRLADFPWLSERYEMGV